MDPQTAEGSQETPQSGNEPQNNEPQSGQPANTQQEPSNESQGQAPESQQPTNYGLDEKWRETFANGDEKRLNQLNRYDTPEKFIESTFELRNKFAQGQVAEAPTSESTPEQIAEWREAHGVPATPDEYQITLDENTPDFNDADKPFLETMLRVSHENNLPHEVVSQMANAFKAAEQLLAEDTELLDQRDASKVTETMRESWGPDYQTNLNHVYALLNRATEEVRDSIMSARDPNGQLIFNNPAVLEYMSGLARDAMPGVTVVPNSTNPLKDIQGRIAEIEATMGTDAYRNDEGVQKELRELYEADAKLQR